jgi:large repetitive protein
MTTCRIAGFAILAGTLISTIAAAQGVDDGHGKQWRQLTDTVGVSWNEVAEVCPRDGISACSGAAGGHDLTGWVWATDSEVIELFSNYAPDILTSPNVQGQQYFFAASAFFSSFRPTFSFFITYQTGQFVAGWTASTDAAGLPVAGGVSAGTTPVSITGSFGVAAVTDPAAVDGMRGVFLWRPTGLGTNAVIANDDVGQVPSPAGGTAVPDVLANDWIGGAPATLSTVTLSQESSTSPTVMLDPSNASVLVGSGTPAATHTVVYKICETVNPGNCGTASVTVTILPYAIHAANDQGSISPSTRGTAIASVLANDSLGDEPATTANVTLSQVSSSNAGVTLDGSDGSVDVARGADIGTHALVYQICETASPSNCAQATATVTVVPYLVTAVNDAARASSKLPGTAIGSVLANDWLGNAPATVGNVRLSLVSLSPANNDIRLELADGSVDVLRRTQSGTYRLVYQICDIASPGNCGQATVTLDLSGK